MDRVRKNMYLDTEHLRKLKELRVHNVSAYVRDLIEKDLKKRKVKKW